MARIGRRTRPRRAVAILTIVVMLAASLFLPGALVSADILSWSEETIPSTDGYVLFPGADVADLAVSADGVMFAVTGNDTYCYKSADGGVTWSQLSKNFGVILSFVGVALDDSDVVAVANTTDVWISTNGGSAWASLGTVSESGSTASQIKDMTVSATDGLKNYVGVAGINTNNEADIWWYDVGATAPKWHSTRGKSGFDTSQDTAAAVAFSPNVASDKVMVAITANTSASGNVCFQIFSLSIETWNYSAGFGSGYPVKIQNNSSDITGLQTASISLAPDYLGSDDEKRIAFVGLNTGGVNVYGGIYRLKDATDEVIKDDVDIHSVHYDGANLVAGATDSNKVYRSANPLGIVPGPSTAAAVQRPGGENKVVVGWAGSDVVAGTSGNLSAFAISTDNGTTFNDISLLVAGTDVSDFAIAGDDTTIYATDTESGKLYKSTNTGANWTELTNPAGATEPQLVAVAPDNADVVAIVADGNEVYVSTNGGIAWDSLDTVSESGSTASQIKDMAVSATDGLKNYVGVAGINTNSEADIWWFDFGAPAQKWHSTRGMSGFDTSQDMALAVAFSPNVASDKVMVAITANTSASGNVNFQIFSLTTWTWNAPFGSGYPVKIQNNGTDIGSLQTASISLAPDYLGYDDAMRIAFVGLNTAWANPYAGIYRLKDDSDSVIKDGVNIHSVAFDGTNLVAGATDSTKVYRSANPLATTSLFRTTSALKRPGTLGNTKVVVSWKGSDVVAGTSGTASAFAISRDNGKSFNDLSFIDTASSNLGSMLDVAVSADGSIIYMLCNDGNALSLFRKASSWERVLSISGAGSNYIVRIAPDNPNAVYLAERGSYTAKTIYYSQEGGDTKWFTRTARYVIQDLAVESADVAYIAVYGPTTVSKTTNSGFTWGTARDTELAKGKMLVPAGASEPQLVAVAPDDANVVAIVADDNEVYISTNGGRSWGSLGIPQEGGGGAAMALYDIAISATTVGGPPDFALVNYVAVAGIESGPLANVWYFDLGASAPKWNETNSKTGFSGTDQDTAAAVAFSPNVASDKVMVAITANTSASGNVCFQMFSLSTNTWNTPFGSGYPVKIQNNSTDIGGLQTASISLSPDYLGSDDAMRIAFVGLNTAWANPYAGIYRLKDDKDEVIKDGVNIHSVAFDGTNLVAGATDSTKVYRSADPLATTPTLNATSALNRPSGDNKVVVDWAGANVMAGTSGNASAFAVSSDNGTIFTDIGLTMAGTDVSDFAIAGDDTTIYATDKESDKLYKSTDGGYTWAAATETWLGGGNMIVSLGTDKLLVGSNDGYVSYSTDGNSSWTMLNQQIEAGALLTQVTAGGLASGDYIYAASSKANTKVVRWQVGTSMNWMDMAAPTSGGYGAYGIALADGVLYVQTYNGTDSCTFQTTSPAISTPSPSMWSKLLTEGVAFNAPPQSLKVSTGSTKLWSVDISAPKLYSYTDTVPDIMVSPSSIDFGSIPVGSSSANWTVFVSNVGTANLTVSDNVSIVGPNADQFLIVSDNCSGQSLAPSNNATLEVAFTPTSSGNQTATLSIPSNDPDEATVNVTLYGNGTTAPTPHTVNLTASPVNITADGASISTIMAAVSDQYYNLVPDGTNVVFATNHGSLGSSNVTKQTSGGVATASLTSVSSNETVIATVTATAGSVSAATAVFFIPAGGAEVAQSETETVSGNGTMTNSATGGDVSIDAIGDHNITTAKYAGNPGGTPSFNATGDYYDVHLDSGANVTSLTIEFCPAAPGTVIYYWNGASWQPCSDQSFSGGCIVVTITDSTFPSLSDLTGLVFGSGLTVTPPPPVEVGGEVYPMNKLGILAPWIVLAAVIIAGAIVVMRRRSPQS